MIHSTIQKNEEFLEQSGADIQANIFAPHRRDHVLLLFLHFTGDEGKRPVLQQMLKTLAANSKTRQGLYLTSVKNQREVERENKRDREFFCNCYFTAAGLQALGATTDKWEPILHHLEKNRQDLTQQDQWDEEYRNRKPIHALLLLAHQQTDALKRKKAQLENAFFPRMGVELQLAEWGQVYKKRFYPSQRRGFTVEHFGYADGLSNPWITTKDARHKGKEKHRRNWDPTTSYSEFLVKEPEATKRWGSYLVFRKYEQHISRFNKATEALAKKLKLTPEEAGAYAFGRRKDGSSLEINPNRRNMPELSDFLFTSGRCPVFAHTRKMNSRNYPEEKLPKSLRYPIMRRGVTYGERQTVYNGIFTDEEPEHPVGLLFMSFQNSIGKFQSLIKQAQKTDPILGALEHPQYQFQHEIEGLNDLHEGFGGFASLRGGFNLYAPSLSFFQELSFSPDLRSRSLNDDPAVQNENTMEPIQTNIPIFGQDRNAFLRIVKYYNDIKVGYDAMITAYGQAYRNLLPEGGTVPVRHQQPIQDLLVGMQNLPETNGEALGFEFEVPLRKGFQATIEVVLTSWDGTETLASTHLEKVFFNGPDDKSPQVLDAKADDPYGYIRIVLNKQEGDDLKDPATYLQNKLRRWWDKGSPVTNRLFLLRVKQIVWAIPNDFSFIGTKEFECRDDSIVLEFMEDLPPEG